MNKDEEFLKDLQEHVDLLHEKVEQYVMDKTVKVKPKTVWDLKKGDTYFELRIDGEILEYTWEDKDFERDFLKQGNVLLTRKEAEDEVRRREIRTELKRLANGYEFKRNSENYYIYFDADDCVVSHDYNDVFKSDHVYFSSSHEAQNAIDTIGEDKLKFLMGVCDG